MLYSNTQFRICFTVVFPDEMEKKITLNLQNVFGFFADLKNTLQETGNKVKLFRKELLVKNNP